MFKKEEHEQPGTHDDALPVSPTRHARRTVSPPTRSTISIILWNRLQPMSATKKKVLVDDETRPQYSKHERRKDRDTGLVYTLIERHRRQDPDSKSTPMCTVEITKPHKTQTRPHSRRPHGKGRGKGSDERMHSTRSIVRKRRTIPRPTHIQGVARRSRSS